MSCPGNCDAKFGTFSVILESETQAVILEHNGNMGVHFAVDLSNGSLIGSIKTVDPPQVGLFVTDMSYSLTFGKIYIMITHGTSYYKLKYDPTSQTFGNTYIFPGYKSGFIKELNGYTFMGLYNDISRTVSIVRVFADGANSEITSFPSTLYSITMSANATY